MSQREQRGPALCRERPMADTRTRIGRFLTDEQGAVTIEFTVLVPFFILLMVLLVDTSVVYMTHSEMFSTARDIARRMSTGELSTEQEVLDYAAGTLFLGDRTYTVDADFGEEMRCAIAVPVADAAIFGIFFRPLLDWALVASAVTSREPMIIPAAPAAS